VTLRSGNFLSKTNQITEPLKIWIYSKRKKFGKIQDMKRISRGRFSNAGVGDKGRPV
jgi:hypothetical protein